MQSTDLHKDKKFLLRFVTSYSILLIFVLIMGLFLYQYGIKDAKKSLIKQNTDILESSVSSMDFTVKQLTTLTTQLANYTPLIELINMEETSNPNFYTTAITTMEYLKDYIAYETILPIYDYFLYLPKVNYLLSTSQLTSSWLYYRYTGAMKKDLYNDWLEELNSRENILSLVSMGKYVTSIDNYNYMLRIPLSDYKLFSSYPGMVCFEFKRSDLYSIFSRIELFDHGFLIVADKAGNESFRIDADKSYNFSYEEVIELMQKNNFTTGILETTYDNEDVIITTVTSSVNGWKYYLVQPAAMAFRELSKYQMVHSLIICMTLGFSFAFIYMLSKRNVKPIIQINSELQTSMQKNSTLQKALEDQKPLVYNSYLARIMKGLISTQEELDEIIEFLHIDTTEYKYRILYASAYLDELEFYVEDGVESDNSKIKLSSYKDVIKSYFFQYFGNDIFIYDADVNSFAIILSSPIEEDIESDIIHIREMFTSLHDQLVEEHSIWLFGGLGNRNSDITYLWKSYQQAMQAASFVRKGHIFQSFYHLKNDHSSYYYPFEMAQQLTNFITAGNTKQIREIFRLIYRMNFEERSLPLNLIKWLLSDIRNTLIKVRFQVSATEENKELLSKIDLSFQDHKTIELMEDLALKLSSLFEKKNDGNKLIASIQQYINENYNDSSLSLKKISEVFDISESYFSYLFKVEMKQNFSEYLEQLRMEQAMLLVKTTNINVSELYLEVGYNNANSFRRAFKKVHGVAPKAIRDAMNS